MKEERGAGLGGVALEGLPWRGSFWEEGEGRSQEGSYSKREERGVLVVMVVGLWLAVEEECSIMILQWKNCEFINTKTIFREEKTRVDFVCGLAFRPTRIVLNHALSAGQWESVHTPPVHCSRGTWC